MEKRCKNFAWFREGEVAVQCGTPLAKAIEESPKKREDIIKALEGITLPPNGVYYCSTCLPNRPIYYAGNKTLVQTKPIKFEQTFCKNLFCNQLNTERSAYCQKHEEEYELVNERKRLDNRGAFPLCFVKPHEPTTDLEYKRRYIRQNHPSDNHPQNQSSDNFFL